MKRSYAIILALALVLVIGVGGLALYAEKSGILISEAEGDASGEKNQEENQAGASDTESNDEQADGSGEGDSIADDPAVPEDEVVPFTYLAEKDGVLYTTNLAAKERDIDGAEVIPADSELFAVLGDDVYYVTPGNDEFAPELRRCGTDGNNDISITEFVSPLGAPAFVNNGIYSAYYTEIDGGLNNGIYRYDIGSGTAVKAIEGEYIIFGYDAEHIYYCELQSAASGTELFRMDYDGGNKTKVLDFNVPTDSIVISGNYVFFSAFSDRDKCYKLYRSPKDGNGNIDEYAFECMSDNFDVIDGRIYYQADNSVYCAMINGDAESKLFDLDADSRYAFGFLRRGGILYFSEQSDSGVKNHKYDESTGVKS